MAKRTRKSYTEEQRARILSTAQAEGLTALDVQKRFGVTPVTYYSWRKKRGIKGKRGRRPAGGVIPGAGLDTQVRHSVQRRIREILPAIVREEVEGYLEVALGRRQPSGHRRG